MVPEYSEKWMSIGFGIRIEDVILISMLGAATLKVILSNRKQFEVNNLGVSVYIILFGLWISFEVARNVSVYGFSAPGEFRYRYLILSIPLYIALFISSADQRKKLLKLLIAFSLFIPISCIPIIGQLKGWSIGPEDRFFSSSISLGFLYGLLALALGKKYKVLGINNILYWFIIVFSGLMIIIDSHRSVWLATLAAGATLLWINEINYQKMMSNALIIIVSGIIIFFLAQQFIMLRLKTNLVDFVVERASELIKIDESYKNNVSWRMVQWKAQMAKFYASPIIGEGFGSYWGFSGIKGDLGIQPHNFYVQTLVKLGIIGMLLYLIIMLKIFVKLKRILSKFKVKTHPAIPMLSIGLAILVASHAFFIAYSLEYYSLLFIGLSVSSLKDEKYLINA
jgi:O-antigen ligase